MKLKKFLAIRKDRMIKKIRHFLSPIRRSKINNSNFTIISNNCWGGKVYQRYGLSYQSPTVGLYFFASDYIKFVSNLSYYLSTEIEMIDSKQSKYFDVLKQRNQLNCPIGKLDDVEVVFLHYNTNDEAKTKWSRRAKRVNWDNIIVKFSMMNCYTEDLLDKFEEIPYFKFIFVNDNDLSIGKDNIIFLEEYENCECIRDDTSHYSKYIDINSLLNDRTIVKRKTKFFM